VLFGLAESGGDIQFDGYDPNIPDRPVKLHYSRTGRTFSFSAEPIIGPGEISM